MPGAKRPLSSTAGSMPRAFADFAAFFSMAERFLRL